MPATARIRMVYKNRGLVKNGCCVVPSAPACIPPTSTTITTCRSKCENCPKQGDIDISIVFPTQGEIPDQIIILPSPPVVYQWYWIDGSGGKHPFSDGNNIVGSQTSRICLTPTKGECTAYDIYCVYSNNCGTITTNTYSTCFEPNT